MKVLQINVTYGVGSTGRIVQDIHRRLQKEDIESFVIYGRNKRRQENNTFYFGNKLSLYIDASLSRLTGFIGYFSIIPTNRLIKRIKMIQPDIIHLHNIHGYFLNIPMLLRFLYSFEGNIIWTLHDEFVYTGKCAYSQSCMKFVGTCSNCPLLQEYPKTLFFDFSKHMHIQKRRLINSLKNLTIVTPSEWLANRTKLSLLKNRAIRVINNGIDTSKFQSVVDLNTNKSNPDKLRFLFLNANLDDYRKGHHWIHKMADQEFEQEVEFVVVGSGKIKFDHERINYIDKTDSVDQLVDLYSSSDFLLILSEFENYPTVCLEASSMNLPVIGFDVGGVREAIVNVPFKLFRYGDESIISFISSLRKGDLKGLDQADKKGIDVVNMTKGYLQIYGGTTSD
jgi:glycosyltransferase involved in cell wall biosynthesis